MDPVLLIAAKSGDHAAFTELVQPHRKELLLHCYRILGSYMDAEDALQEAFLAAWLGIGGYEARASLRTWLYRIATHRCLNLIRSASRRPLPVAQPPGGSPPPTSSGEVVWLQPYPDALLEGLPETAPGPDAVYELRESVSLAFVRALQLLPAQQRSVLVLRDVLGYRASETADLLDITEDAANGALKRARAALRADRDVEEAVAPSAPRAQLDLERRFVEAFTSGDIDGLLEVFSDDVWVRMPPLPLEYRGREAARAFFANVADHLRQLGHMVPVSVNGQTGWGEYVAHAATQTLRLSGVLVVDVRGDAITALTHFDSSVAAYVGLPRTLIDPA